MSEAQWSRVTAQLRGRALPGGGFGNGDGEDFRPDATAWAVLALTAQRGAPDLQEAGRRRLAACQAADGRVSLSPEHPEALWPTPLAILAWHRSPAHQEAQDRAVRFLLATSGRHWEKDPDAVYGHDSNLKGWPWTADTASWAEPTALALVALEASGFGEHERAAEARRLLLDRQIQGGGWNYGNTVVFDQRLHPMPESTGMALNGLGGRVPRTAIQPSLAYLEGLTPRLATPLALSWALLGLGAWGARPVLAGDFLEACLARQDSFGGYDTVSLALLLVAHKAAGGLASIYPQQKHGSEKGP